jgi:acetyl-CoA carboxylase biotin carboxyl carrier protein
MAAFKIDEEIFDKLAEILEKHQLGEVEYQSGNFKIRIAARHNTIAQHAAVTVPPESAAVLPPRTHTNEKEEPNLAQHPGALTSPMVGVCYMAPEPSAPNFVAIGDEVREGQPVLIIEAMKVMNLIKTQKSGKVTHIAVKNGEPVEYGQLLLVIE